MHLHKSANEFNQAPINIGSKEGRGWIGWKQDLGRMGWVGELSVISSIAHGTNKKPGN